MPITRYFGMLAESTYNEPWDAPTLTYLDIGEANITPEQNPETVPTMTFQAPTRVLLGDFGLAGNINTVADTKMFGHLLKGVLGNAADPIKDGANDEWQHTFWSLGPRGNSENTLPSYKFALGEDLLVERRMSGVFFPSMELTFNRGGGVDVVGNVVAAKETYADGSFSAPAPGSYPADTQYLFAGNRTQVFMGDDDSNQIEWGVTATQNAVEAISLNFDNQPADDIRRMGSRFLNGFVPQEQNFTGTMTQSFATIAEARRFLEGGEAVPTTETPADRITTFPLIVNTDLGVLVDSSGGSNNYRLAFYYPRVYYTSYSKPQAKRDRSTVDLAFKALMPLDGEAPDLDVVVYDDSGNGTADRPFMDLTDTKFDDSTESNRELAAVYAILYNAQSAAY